MARNLITHLTLITGNASHLQMQSDTDMKEVSAHCSWILVQQHFYHNVYFSSFCQRHTCLLCSLDTERHIFYIRTHNLLTSKPWLPNSPHDALCFLPLITGIVSYCINHIRNPQQFSLSFCPIYPWGGAVKSPLLLLSTSTFCLFKWLKKSYRGRIFFSFVISKTHMAPLLILHWTIRVFIS